MGRAPTHPPVADPEYNAAEIARLFQKYEMLARKVERDRELLITVCGPNGHQGALAEMRRNASDAEKRLAESLHGSSTSQGKRIGSLEEEVGKLKQTRAQLLLIGALAMLLLGAVAKSVLGRLL